MASDASSARRAGARKGRVRARTESGEGTLTDEAVSGDKTDRKKTEQQRNMIKLLLAMFFDLVCVLTLYAFTDGKGKDAGSHLDHFFERAIMNYKHSTADLVIAYVIRLIAIIILVPIACKFKSSSVFEEESNRVMGERVKGEADRPLTNVVAGDSIKGRGGARDSLFSSSAASSLLNRGQKQVRAKAKRTANISTTINGGGGINGGGMQYTLLDSKGEEEDADAEEKGVRDTKLGADSSGAEHSMRHSGDDDSVLFHSPGARARNRKSQQDLEAENDRKETQISIKRNLVLALLFTIITAISVYTGIKCVCFDFTDTSSQGVLMSVSVLFINMGFICSKNFVASVVMPKGVLVRSLHPRPLNYALPNRSKCSNCSNRIRTEKAWVAAGYNACVLCFREHLKKQQKRERARRTSTMINEGKEDSKERGEGSALLGKAYVEEKEFARRGGGGGAEDVGERKDRGSASSRHGFRSRSNTPSSSKGTRKRKKVASKGGGNIRSINAVRKGEEMDTRTYLMVAVGLGRPEWPLLLVATVCLAISSAATLALPKYQGAVVQSVVDKDRGQFEMDIRIFVGLSVLTGVFGAIRNTCFRIVGRKIGIRVRNQIFSSIIKQDIAFFDCTSTGQLTARMTSDAGAMVSPIRTMLNSLITSCISVVGGLVMCFYTSWKLSILAFTSIGPIIYLTGMYASWSKVVNREIWTALGDANAVATEAICNIRTVRAFSTEHLERSKYQSSTSRALNKGMKDAIVGGGTYLTTNGLDLGAGALILWYGGTVAMQQPDQLSVGELVTFQLYWAMINSGYKTLNSMLNNFTRAAGAAQRVVSLLDCLPEIDTNDGKKLSEFTDSIEMKNIGFHYQMRPDNVVLKDLTLTINKGEVVALVGPSGGGKSTVVRLLMRFYDPVSGRILIDGNEMDSLNVAALHNRIGVVTQETQLFAGTIFANIAYGIEDPDPNDVRRAAKLANAHNFIVKFEDGYATRVGERGVRLSGGQKQRIAIARVLMRRPDILLLDEATSALDAESEALVQEALDRLISQSRSTVVLVAHRLSTGSSSIF